MNQVMPSLAGSPCPPALGPFRSAQAMTEPRRSSKGQRGWLLALELTERCNLSCIHCYSSARLDAPRTGAMTLSEWEATLVWGRRNGFTHLQFIGGEPTLHPDFPDLLTYAASLGF